MRKQVSIQYVRSWAGARFTQQGGEGTVCWECCRPANQHAASAAVRLRQEQPISLRTCQGLVAPHGSSQVSSSHSTTLRKEGQGQAG